MVPGVGITITPSGSMITIAGTNAGAIGAYDSQLPSNNALVLSAGVLYAQSADATYPGMVNTGAQTFAGTKTFTGTIAAANLSGTNTGDVTLGTPNGLSLINQVLSLDVSSSSSTGALTSADWTTFNSKQPAGAYITGLTGDVTAAGPGTVAATVNAVGGVAAASVASGATLANNATSVNTANAIVRRDANGKFLSPSVPEYVFLSANQATTSAVPVDVSGMSFTIAANSRYYYKFSVAVSSSSINQAVRFAVTSSAINTVFTAICDSYVNSSGAGAAYADTLVTSGQQTTAGAMPAATTLYYNTIEGIVVTGGSGGTLQLQFMIETAGNTATISNGSLGMLWTLV